MKIKIGIVEDDNFIRESFHTFLARQEEFDVTLVTDSVEIFIASLNSDNSPSILLLDINLPGMTGIEGIPYIRESLPDVEVIMITVLNDNESIFQALCAGAAGYLAKDTPFDKLKEAIQVLNAGGSVLTPGIARKVIQHFQPARTVNNESLTQKEREVVQGIIDGLSYKLIADKCGISIDTVRTHIRKIYRKLRINSKGELMMKFHKGAI